MSQPIVIKFDGLREKAVDLAKEVAESTLEKGKELEEHQATNNELQYEYEENMERLKELKLKLQKQSNKICKAELVKTVNASSVVKNKES